MYNKLIIIILITCLYNIGFSEEILSTDSLKSVNKNWSAVAYFDTQAGLEKKSDIRDSLSSTLLAILKYNFKDNYMGQLTLGASHNYKVFDNKSELINGIVAISKNIQLNSIFSFSGKSKIYLPFNKEDRESRSFQTQLAFSPSITSNLDTVGIKNTSLTYSMNISQSFHKYKTAVSGSVNTRNTLSHKLEISYGVNDKLSFTSNIKNTHSWTHESTRTPDRFSFEINGNYNLLTKLNIGIGYSIGDTTFGYDGRSLNIDLLDITKSSIYSYATYAF